MIMIFRKKKISVSVGLLLLCTILSGFGYQKLASKSTFLPTENKTVIIDAGHAAPREYYRTQYCNTRLAAPEQSRKSGVCAPADIRGKCSVQRGAMRPQITSL